MFSRYHPAALLICLVAFAACKKKDDGGGGLGALSPLIPASTGWERIGTIRYSYTTVGFANQNSMQPDDIDLLSNGDIAVLYSENYHLSGVDGRQYFRARCVPGSSDTAKTVKLSLGSGNDVSSYGLFVNRFIPGAYEAVSLRYQGSPYCTMSVIYEANAGGPAAGSHFIHHANYVPRIYSNGDVLNGTLNYSNIPEMDYFQKGAGWVFFNSSTVDTVQRSGFTPLRLTDNKLVGAFLIYKNYNTAYLSIGDLNPNAAPPATKYYTPRFLQEMPLMSSDFTQHGVPVLLASLQQGATTTIVVADYKEGKSWPSKLHAFQWTEGATGFTTLYSDVSISQATYEILRKSGVQCTPGGTVYNWDDATGAGALTTVDAAGEHTLGATGNTGLLRIGAVRWLNNAFYGVVYPSTDQYDTDHNLRMDVVKLKQ